MIMNQSDLLEKKIKNYVRYEQIINQLNYIIFTLATIIISVTIALLLLKSPIFGLLGIIPVFFYRNIPFIERIRNLEEKMGFKDRIVNSIQLSKIPPDGKEGYSRELIDAYINAVAERIKDIDLKKYIDFKPLRRHILILLIAIAIFLLIPAFFPEYFWYSLTRRIDYIVAPQDKIILKDSPVELRIKLWGVYIPKSAWLLIEKNGKTERYKIELKNGAGKKKLKVSEEIKYWFKFFDRKTKKFSIGIQAPVFIENLYFHCRYPAYTGLKPETRTGRQITVPRYTRVEIEGQASQHLSDGWFEFTDTLELSIEKRDFRGNFTVKKSGVAYLHLKSYNEIKEPIHIYSIPDLPPMVSIFYPGYNINLPRNMKLDIGIRCSDDYGLKSATFYYTFKKGYKKYLNLQPGAVEDTIFFEWDLSKLNLLPGDEVSYYVIIKDNAGYKTKSKVYYVYFPSMEQIYEEVVKKEDEMSKDMKLLYSRHKKQMEDTKRLHKKLLAERQASWAEQEKLRQIIKNEKGVSEKIEAWKQELEKTIKKLNESVILDRKSVERLKEITRILKELAPEKLRQALNRLENALNKNPEDLEKALKDMKEHQKELAESLKRTLELLKRFQQEERLKELAETAHKLAEEQKKILDVLKEDSLSAQKEQSRLDKKIKDLADDLQLLSRSKNLESEIKKALARMSENTREMVNLSARDKEVGLSKLSADLDQLYKNLTKSRRANLYKNLLATLKQVIAISKQEERLLKENIPKKARFQQDIIQATRTIAESLYTQQTRSLYVSPTIGKRLARAIIKMETAKGLFEKKRRGKEFVKQSMAELNIVAFQILQSLKNVASGESSTGMDKFLQILSDISKGEMSISQGLMNILPIPSQGPSARQRAQLKSLARKQGKLRQALESLKNEPGIGELGDMIEKLAREMKEMEQQLYQYRIDRQLIRRQQRLITRLLDAQRSIRKEDYTRKRISRPGKEFLNRPRPKEISGNMSRDELRELIQRALRESYPAEYEIYIREYFKKLLEKR